MMENINLMAERFKVEYPDEEACISFFHQQKWLNGFQCTNCGHKEAYIISTRSQPLYECRSCKFQSSLTANTMLHKSRTPLSKWLLTIYLVSKLSISINAVQLSALISVTYKTAWSMLHKIRKVISIYDGTIFLKGEIEGKHEIFMKQHFPSDALLQKEKSVIIARASESDEGASYHKIKIIARGIYARQPLAKAEEKDFLQLYSETSLSTTISFDSRFQSRCVYFPPNLTDSNHSLTDANHSVQKTNKVIPKSAHLSGLASKAFQWMNDTFHGIGMKYAQHYLDEHCFRLNYLCNGSPNGLERLSGFMLAHK